MLSYLLWWPLVNRGAAKSSFFMLATQFTLSLSMTDWKKDKLACFFKKAGKKEGKRLIVPVMSFTWLIRSWQDLLINLLHLACSYPY